MQKRTTDCTDKHGYKFTCALTGLCCLTTDGAAILDAAHIEPWAASENDDIQNSLALCKNAHWMFDEGLTPVHTFVNFSHVREIYFYRSASGDCPVGTFLARLDSRQAQKIAWVLRLVKELPIVPKQYFKKLEGTQDIWEVRTDLGNDAFRLLGFWDQGHLIILTNAFAKKTQKTPAREISLAEQRRADYLNRKEKR